LSWETATDWKGLSSRALAEAGVERDRRGFARIPYFTEAGGLYAQRVVKPNGDRYWEPGDGREVILFGLDHLAASFDDRSWRDLIIAEGESDTLALRDAMRGLPVDVVGVPGSSTWKAKWRSELAGYGRVYVVGDGDAAGETFGLSVRYGPAWLRSRRDRSPDTGNVVNLPEGFDVARIVRLPEGTDARGLLQAHGPDALDSYFASADADYRLAFGFKWAEAYEELRAYLAGEPGGAIVVLRATSTSAVEPRRKASRVAA
jgi:hypothetical protein